MMTDGVITISTLMGKCPVDSGLLLFEKTQKEGFNDDGYRFTVGTFTEPLTGFVWNVTILYDASAALCLEIGEPCLVPVWKLAYSQENNSFVAHLDNSI